jgi:hypothetical protein
MLARSDWYSKGLGGACIYTRWHVSYQSGGHTWSYMNRYALLL